MKLELEILYENLKNYYVYVPDKCVSFDWEDDHYIVYMLNYEDFEFAINDISYKSLVKLLKNEISLSSVMAKCRVMKLNDQKLYLVNTDYIEIEDIIFKDVEKRIEKYS